MNNLQLHGLDVGAECRGAVLDINGHPSRMRKVPL